MQTNFDTRQLIKYGVIIFGVILLIITVVWFFSNSWITIKTPGASSEISIIKDGIVINTLKGASVFTSVSPGSYTISVKDGSKMSTKYIDAPGGQFHTYSYSLKDVGQTQNITAIRANSLYVDGTNLHYVDMNNEASGYISVGQDGIHRLAGDLSFSQIKWSGANKGIGLSSTIGTEETSSNVTSIGDGKIKNYSLPSGTENKNQSIAVSPNGTGWFAGGDSLYQQGQSDLTRIYQAKHAISVLAATNTSALVVEAISEDGDSQTMQLVSVKSDGSETRGSSFSFHADPNLSLGAAYSPDGSHIILTSMGTGIIYTNDLKPVDQLPLHTMVTSAIWKDNSTVLYAAETNILAYALDTKTADVVGVSEPGSTITALAYDKTGDSVVISVSGATSSDSIQKINLKPTKNELSSAVQSLISYLPRDYAVLSCRANYNTFNQPFVVIEQRTSVNNEQNARDCEDIVKQMFDKYHIDTAQFSYAQLLP